MAHRPLLLLALLIWGFSTRTSFGQGEPSKKEKPENTTWSARIESDPEGKKIQGLVLPEGSLPVKLIPKDGKLRPFVELKGRFNRPGWKLLIDAPGKPVELPLKPDGSFTFYAILKARYSDIPFRAAGPGSEPAEFQPIKIYSPNAQEYRIGASLGEFSLAIGAGAFSYFQTGFGSFSSKNIMQEIGYISPSFMSRFGLAASFRSPLWTISSAPIDASPDLLKVNAELSYQMRPARAQPLTVYARAGGAYLTLLSYSNAFGFENLIAPSLGASAIWNENADEDYVALLRYTPLGSFLGPEWGIDFSLGYKWRLQNLHSMRVDLAYSGFRYYPVPGAQVRSSLYALMFSYIF
jgi:hypothetical protein